VLAAVIITGHNSSLKFVTLNLIFLFHLEKERENAAYRLQSRRQGKQEPQSKKPGGSSRVPAYQLQGPEFKPQYGTRGRGASLCGRVSRVLQYLLSIDLSIMGCETCNWKTYFSTFCIF
jgi:hypothetical protein